jgi:hypothetical protein
MAADLGGAHLELAILGSLYLRKARFSFAPLRD